MTADLPERRIVLTVQRTMRPNGDRDRQRHPCFRFDVAIVSPEGTLPVGTFDQWNPHWTHIDGNRAEFMAAAIERARLARRITSLPIVVQGDQP